MSLFDITPQTFRDRQDGMAVRIFLKDGTPVKGLVSEVTDETVQIGDVTVRIDEVARFF